MKELVLEKVLVQLVDYFTDSNMIQWNQQTFNNVKT